jgi:hypothetical protein
MGKDVRWIQLSNGERLNFDPPVSIHQAMVRKWYAELEPVGRPGRRASQERRRSKVRRYGSATTDQVSRNEA